MNYWIYSIMDLEPATDYWFCVTVLLKHNKFLDLPMVYFRTKPCLPETPLVLDQHVLPKSLVVTLTELVPRVRDYVAIAL